MYSYCYVHVYIIAFPLVNIVFSATVGLMGFFKKNKCEHKSYDHIILLPRWRQLFHKFITILNWTEHYGGWIDVHVR